MKKAAITAIILLISLFFLPPIASGITNPIQIEQGDRITIQVGKSAVPLIVRLSENSKPIARTEVTFKIIKGEGKIEPSSVTTDNEGRAKTMFTPGLSPGDVIVQVKSPKYKGVEREINLKVTLDKQAKIPAIKPAAKPAVDTKVSKKAEPAAKAQPATPKPSPKVTAQPKKAEKKIMNISPDKSKIKIEGAKNPAIIIAFSGANQKISPGEKAPSKLEAQIMDDQGNPIEGSAVDFKITEGKGSISPARSYSDKKGIASAIFTAGLTKSDVTIKAEVAGKSDLSTIFNIEIAALSKRSAEKPAVPSTTSPSKSKTAPVKKPAPKIKETNRASNAPEPVVKAVPEIREPETTSSSNTEPAAIKEEAPVVLSPSASRINLTPAVPADNKPAPVITLSPTAPVEPARPAAQPQPEPEKPYDNSKIVLPENTKVKPRGYYSSNPESISVVAGNFQTAQPGAKLPQPVVVYVVDVDGNPAEATVEFTVLSGDANIVSKQVRTDERGLSGTFVIANSSNPIRIVAEVLEKPGLSTIAYANAKQQGSGNSNEPKTNNPVIKSSVATNRPDFPAVMAFYSALAGNTDSIEKTKVVPLEIGVTDFRNKPVATTIRFSVVKGKVSLLNPVVQTNQEGRGICYVDIGSSMGIFTIEAQSLDNPDLKAEFRSGPEIRTAPASGDRPSQDTANSSGSYEPPQRTVASPVNRRSAQGASSNKPSIIGVLNGAGQKAKAGQKFANPIEVFVSDSKGNPSAGVTLTFSCTKGSAKFEPAQIKTSSEGKATIYASPAAAGDIDVMVKVSGVKLQTTFQLKGE